MKKNHQTVNALTKMDKLLNLIKPSIDPRLYETAWLNLSNNIGPEKAFKSISIAQKEYNYVKKRFNYVNRKLKSLSYEGLITIFKDENFDNLIRHLKSGIRGDKTKKEKIDIVVSIVKRTLRKLDLDQSSVSETLFEGSYKTPDFEGSNKGTSPSRKVLSRNSNLSRNDNLSRARSVRSRKFRIRRSSHMVAANKSSFLGMMN
jgi:hypothetical protein